MSEDKIYSKFVDAWKGRNQIQPKIVEKNWIDSYSEWAKGRNQYLTFLIRVRDEKIVKKIVEIQNKLSAIPCVDPFPKEYLHITVKECGFLAESEEYEDNVLTENIGRIITQAQEILQAHSRFKVLLSRPNIFQDVAFIEIHDKGRIGAINKQLQSIQEIRKIEYDYLNFLPHISISQFQNRQQFSKLIRYLEKSRETEFGELTVNYIELVNAHLSGKYPILKTIHAFKLR